MWNSVVELDKYRSSWPGTGRAFQASGKEYGG